MCVTCRLLTKIDKQYLRKIVTKLSLFLEPGEDGSRRISLDGRKEAFIEEEEDYYVGEDGEYYYDDDEYSDEYSDDYSDDNAEVIDVSRGKKQVGIYDQRQRGERGGRGGRGGGRDQARYRRRFCGHGPEEYLKDDNGAKSRRMR